MTKKDFFSKKNHLRILIEGFLEKKCWSVIVDECIGTNIGIRFGGKKPFKTPLKNKNLTSDECQFDGERWLFIQNCAWRLQSEGKILCGSLSLNPLALDGERAIWLKQLISSKVVSYRLDDVTNDLMLEFSNRFFLKIFCDQMWELDNYSIGAYDGFAITVGPAGNLVEEGNYLKLWGH